MPDMVLVLVQNAVVMSHSDIAVSCTALHVEMDATPFFIASRTYGRSGAQLDG